MQFNYTGLRKLDFVSCSLSRSILILLVVFSSCISHDNKINSPINKLNLQVVHEFSAINKFYNKNFILKFTNSDTRAHPPETVFINLQKLQSITHNLSKVQAKLLLRLIIGHEYVHLIQFDDSTAYSNGEDFRDRIREAQADILAARYAILQYNNDIKISKDTDLFEKYDDKKFIDAYQLFFKLGNPSNSMVNHPTSYQRASSIYRGIRYARFEIFSQKRNLIGKMNSEYVAKMDKIISDERKNLNITDNNSVFSWSWLQANLICHGNPAYLGQFIRLESITDTLWDHQGHVRGKALYQVFLNEGDEPLNVTMEFRAAPFRGSKTPFFDNIEFDQAIYYHHIFKPHTGFSYGDKFIIPSDKRRYEIIIPPDSNALYSVEPIKTNSLAKKKNIEVNTLDRALERTTFDQYLKKINKAISEENISSIVASAGQQSYDGLSICDINFIGIVPLTENFKSLVSYDYRYWGQYQVKLKLFKSKDSVTALKQFNYWEKRIANVLAKQSKQPQDWKIDRIVEPVPKIVGYTYNENPKNVNFLYLKRITMDMSVHPFNMLKGDTYTSSENAGTDFGQNYYEVYMIIRKRPFNFLYRDWPRRWNFASIYADD